MTATAARPFTPAAPFILADLQAASGELGGALRVALGYLERDPAFEAEVLDCLGDIALAYDAELFDMIPLDAGTTAERLADALALPDYRKAEAVDRAEAGLRALARSAA